MSLRCRRLAQEPVSHIHRLDGAPPELAGPVQPGPADFLSEEEIAADCAGSYYEAIRAIAEAVRSGAPIPTAGYFGRGS